MNIKRVFGLVLMVVMVCLLSMAFTGCEISVGDPNDLPQFWPDGFVEKEGNTYHVTNGKLAKGMKVVEKRVYFFLIGLTKITSILNLLAPNTSVTI